MASRFVLPGMEPMQVVEMHTCGEPTRIIYSGFPSTSGTLLSQRSTATKQHDHLRRRLMLEPRGHNDMYGAIIRAHTELTDSGQAHIGVLFCHNDGFSTMCGHATIALGRFLVDCHEVEVFPRRKELRFDTETETVQVKLHAPCGVVEVTVPALDGGRRSDPSRPVSFQSVPSFASAINLSVPISPEFHWPELGDCNAITVDIAYGGAFYCLVSSSTLGFPHALHNKSRPPDIKALDHATKQLKAAISTNPSLQQHFHHPSSADLQFLYSVLVTEIPPSSTVAPTNSEAPGSETGLCFFAAQQIDRSPTGSAVAARVALAHAKGIRGLGESWVYESLVSRSFARDGFVGVAIEEIQGRGVGGSGEGEGGGGGSDDGRVDQVDYSASAVAVRVRVEGKAWYTGWGTFVVEEEDVISRDGFAFAGVASGA